MRECCSGCNELRQAIVDLAQLVRALADEVDNRGVGDDASAIAERLKMIEVRS
jgi:hypothetical protein